MIIRYKGRGTRIVSERDFLDAFEVSHKDIVFDEETREMPLGNRLAKKLIDAMPNEFEGVEDGSEDEPETPVTEPESQEKFVVLSPQEIEEGMLPRSEVPAAGLAPNSPNPLAPRGPQPSRAKASAASKRTVK